MSPIADFRLLPFNTKAIEKCGAYVGHRTYWKLYTIENLLRIVIHSVLSVQISTGWWSVAVDRMIQRDSEQRQKRYLEKSPRSKSKLHGVYYVDLKDLNEIIRANANLFYPIVPDVDRWLVGVEELRLPRNVVAHMNFPNNLEIKRIDSFYNDCQKLIGQVQSKVDIRIP